MKLKLSFFFLLFAAALTAQPKQNSPYSRYGIGDPLNQFFAAQAGFGGQAIAFHDPFHLSLVNPASYAYLRATTLEGGMYAKNSYYKYDMDSRNNWSGNLSYLALGFPLRSPINEVLDKRKSPWQFGMGMALTPKTLVGYNVVSRDTIIDPPQGQVGDVQSVFEGNGGTYQFTWSNAAKYKNTAVGLNIGWLFGKNTYESSTFFIDSLPTFANTSRDDIRMNGFVWNLGVQHDIVLKYSENDKTMPVRWVTIGLTGEGSHNINSTADRIFLRSRGRLANGQYESADTLLFESGVDRKIKLPPGFGLGVQYVVANKLRLGAQYNYEGWSSFKNEARPNDSEYRNTSAFSAGVEYIPDYSSYNNYAKRIRLRAGAYYRQDARVVEGSGLDDLGFTVGLGFPVIMPRQQTSFINIALEVGRLGADSPIQETYYRFTFGYTFNDNSWFYKRRFE
ncbi:MAG: hypothetical protein R3D58_13760 [Saprospiraceae bacterium]|nr:hypothetical protein [Lewinellaceae bacterium]